MKIIKNTQPILLTEYISTYVPETSVFFDIETTGLSPANACIYLIGIAYRKDTDLHIWQFLAETKQDESSILEAFLHKLLDFQELLSFNGMQFDLPFIQKRCKKHNIKEELDVFVHRDIYKSVFKLKKLLKLSNCRQKSIEEFLGIFREDPYNGGELIRIFYQYEKTASFADESLLLRHNFEDVTGMLNIVSIFTYETALLANANVIQAQIQHYLPFGSDVRAEELFLTLQSDVTFPKHVLHQTEQYAICMEDIFIKLRIPITNNQLKLYHTNYKDYYYLPEEDTAIHKSVAAYVDTSHRKKATKDTCYTRFSVTNEFLLDTTAQNTFATSILRHLYA